MFTGKLVDIIINLGCGLIVMVISFAVGKWFASTKRPDEQPIISIDNRLIEKHNHEHYHNYYQLPSQQQAISTETRSNSDTAFSLIIFCFATILISAVLYAKYGQFIFYIGYLFSLLFLCINFSMIWFSTKNQYYSFLEPQLRGLIIVLTVLWLLLFAVFLSGTYPFYMPSGVPELMTRLKPLPFIQALKTVSEYGLKPEVYFLAYQAIGLITALLSLLFLLGLQVLCLKSWGSGYIMTKSGKALNFISGLWNRNGQWTSFVIFLFFLVPSFLLLSGIFYHSLSG